MSTCLTAFPDANELVRYAKKFVYNRVEVFRKDISICLKADKKQRHAYMPALITCISLLELFSGLYAGKLSCIKLDGIIEYSKKFLDTNVYTYDRIAILYEMFRHKIAHLSQPYEVFDNHSVSKSHQLKKAPKRLITWQINATNRYPPIDIYPQNGALTKQPPWPVVYDHKCKVSIHRLKVDICKSATGKGGYLYNLKSDGPAQKNFETCMLEFFIK